MLNKTKTVYAYHPITGQYIGETQADADPLVAGHWLLPAYTTDIEPIESDDVDIACFDIQKQTWGSFQHWFNTPLYVKETRERYILNTKNKERVFNGLGELPDWLTDLAPTSDDDVWENNKWVKDEEKVKARQLKAFTEKQAQLMQQAEMVTVGFRDAFITKTLSKEDEALYKAWAAYKYVLTNLATQETFPNAIEWPEVPAKASPFITPIVE